MTGRKTSSQDEVRVVGHLLEHGGLDEESLALAARAADGDGPALVPSALDGREDVLQRASLTSGPTSVSGSAGSPTRPAAIRARSFSRKASYAPSCTRILRVAVHFWPADQKAPA